MQTQPDSLSSASPSACPPGWFSRCALRDKIGLRGRLCDPHSFFSSCRKERTRLAGARKKSRSGGANQYRPPDPPRVQGAASSPGNCRAVNRMGSGTAGTLALGCGRLRIEYPNSCTYQRQLSWKQYVSTQAAGPLILKALRGCGGRLLSPPRTIPFLSGSTRFLF